MIRATAVLPAGHWTQSPTDCVVLDFDERHRRRVTMTGVQGLVLLLDLPDAVMLRSGDALALDDGRLVEVLAAPETLIEVRGGAGPAALARLAWHIGNRHLPAQFTAAAIRIRRDHVIEDMLRRLGARLAPIEAPFDPEGGAYAGAPHAAARTPHDHVAHDHAAHDHASHDHASHGDHDHHGHEPAPAPRHHDHRHRSADPHGAHGEHPGPQGRAQG